MRRWWERSDSFFIDGWSCGYGIGGRKRGFVLHSSCSSRNSKAQTLEVCLSPFLVGMSPRRSISPLTPQSHAHLLTPSMPLPTPLILKPNPRILIRLLRKLLLSFLATVGGVGLGSRCSSCGILPISLPRHISALEIMRVALGREEVLTPFLALKLVFGHSVGLVCLLCGICLCRFHR
jgi:hypothetical protein